MSEHAPAIVWIDARIASSLSTIKDEELAERGVDQIRYVAQERVNELVQAAIGPDELIIQIQDVGGILHGLTNQGRLMAFGQLVDSVPDLAAGWYAIAPAALPELEP